jgi:hypothetical protein
MLYYYIGLSLGANQKKKEKVLPINEIVEIGALNCFQKLP